MVLSVFTLLRNNFFLGPVRGQRKYMHSYNPHTRVCISDPSIHLSIHGFILISQIPIPPHPQGSLGFPHSLLEPSLRSLKGEVTGPLKGLQQFNPAVNCGLVQSPYTHPVTQIPLRHRQQPEIRVNISNQNWSLICSRCIISSVIYI